MANIVVHMDNDFEAYIKQTFNCDSTMIECFNILMLSDDAAFENFIDSELEVKFATIPYQAISHPAIVPCILMAVAYGSLFKKIAQY